MLRFLIVEGLSVCEHLILAPDHLDNAMNLALQLLLGKNGLVPEPRRNSTLPFIIDVYH